MPNFANGTWAPGDVDCRITTPVNSDQRQVAVSLNALLTGLSGVLAAMTGDVAISTGTLAVGSSDTNLATAQQTIAINGVPVVVAAQTNQSFGALGTVPANTWAVVGVERVAAGTTTFTSGAANYTTGYATEALAIAALPAQSADKVRVGYVTVQADAADPFIFATDALAGGATGNPAQATNFYNTTGVADTASFTNVLQIANQAGTVLTSTAG